jgi:hypothetical protein
MLLVGYADSKTEFLLSEKMNTIKFLGLPHHREYRVEQIPALVEIILFTCSVILLIIIYILIQ